MPTTLPAQRTTNDIMGNTNNITDENTLLTAVAQLQNGGGVVNLAAQSGAVTLDLSLGSVFLVNLTGNATSWTFSNVPATSGQTISVQFIQDATGSRTLAGANAIIKLAGAAITLTTTASKRDILTFTQSAGTFYETARAANI